MPARKPSVATLKRQLKPLLKRSVYDLEPEEIDTVFTNIAWICLQEGAKGIADLPSVTKDEYLKQAIRLLVNGTNPELVGEILDEWRASRVNLYDLKYRKVAAGIASLQMGTHPRLVAMKLGAMY